MQKLLCFLGLIGTVLCNMQVQAMEGVSVEIKNETGLKLQIMREESDGQGLLVEDEDTHQLWLQTKEGMAAWIMSKLGKYKLVSYSRDTFEIFDSQNKAIKSIVLSAETNDEALNLILTLKKDKVVLQHRKRE